MGYNGRLIQMKKALVAFAALLAAVISFTFTSCEKEQSDALTGTWVYNADAKHTGGVFMSLTFKGKDSFSYTKTIYESTGEYHVPPTTWAGTYVIEGNTFTIRTRLEGDTQNEENVDKFEFAIEGNNLNVKLIDGGTFYPTGTELTFTK